MYSKENYSMANENIHFVFNYMCLYRSALRPFINDFWFQKQQQMETTKISIEICEKTLSQPKSQFLPLKIKSVEPSKNDKSIL